MQAMNPGKRYCEYCGIDFYPEDQRLRFCFNCDKKRDRALDAYDYLQAEVNTLRRQLRELQTQHTKTQQQDLAPSAQTLRLRIRAMRVIYRVTSSVKNSLPFSGKAKER